MQVTRIALVVSLLAVLLVACGGDDDEDTTRASTVAPSSQSTSTASTAGAAQTPAGSDAELTATPGANAPSATPPSGAGGGVLPSGTASAEDGSGDIVNAGGGEPDTTYQGIDLSVVTLESDGGALTVTFETHDAIPVEPDEGRLYQIAIVLDDATTSYLVQVNYGSATGWVASVYDDAAFDFAELDDEPAIDGNTLVVAFPAELFPDVTGSFVWYASATAIDGTDFTNWTDYVPDSAGPPVFDTADYLPFPS